MTATRLYYTDAFCAAFDAVVTRCEPSESGARVWLDQTAFYPTSGGQPCDIGVVGASRLTDVADDDAGDVVHVVDAPIAVGAAVHGEIDWPRRFDHMQQHTGQHVLSAAFDRVGSARTESFHLGALSATIDLARQVTASEIEAAEDEANHVVWEDRPVHVRFVTADEAAGLPLRKQPSRDGLLRLIDVEHFDLSACGGTHVARTGSIGIIAVSGWEKFRGGTRVEFVCGGRALDRFRTLRDAVTQANRLISVAPHELASGIERLQADAKALSRRLRLSQEQLAAHEARVLLARGTKAGARNVVVESLADWDVQGLKALAGAMIAEPGAAVALFTAARPAQVVVARHADVPLDAAAVLNALTARFGGKGGGKPDLAQGGGLAGDVQELVREARHLLLPASTGAEAERLEERS